jgi:hypothetical protein
MTKQFSNYSDLITFTRASKGHALRPVSYGDELVTNGDFATADDWGTGAGWSVSGGVASHTGATAGYLTQTNVTEVGKIYKISFDITALASGKAILVYNYTGGSSVLSFNTTGSVSGFFVAEDTKLAIRESASAECTIDNVSVKEVTFDQTDGTLTLFEHPDNVPRVEYDADGNRLGLLVEEARTNLITYSEDVNAWSKTNASVSQNTKTAPNGALTADTVTRTSSSADIRQTISVTTGNDYTITIFAKADTDAEIQIDVSNTAFSGADFAQFNIKTGAFVSGGTGATYSVTDVGDGWRRYSLTASCTSTGTTGVIIRLENDEPVYLWGFQFEQGSFPTSYIKTEGSTVSRSADVASIPVADFGYNQSAGTVVIEATTSHPANLTNQQMWQAKDSANENRIEIYQSGSGNPWPRVSALFRDNNSTTQTFLCQTDGWESNNRDIEKVGFAYKSGSSILDTTTDDSPALGTADVPTGMTEVLFKHKGHIKSIKYYPRRITNAQLQEITT